jgi:hypothetical protein
MQSDFQLPFVNALSSTDKDTLTTIFAALVKEINKLRSDVQRLQQGSKR